MSGARTLKNWIDTNKVPDPPKRTEVKAVLSAPEIGPAGARIAQLNLKVPEGVKHQYRQIAARDRVSMIELFYLMIQAYEEKQSRGR